MKKLFSVLLIISILISAFQIVTAAVPAVTVGDFNSDGQINAKDALKVLQSAVQKYHPTDEEFTAGDVDGNQKLNAKDALMILQYAVGLRTEFPASMTEEERYYYDRDQAYKVNYSDFESEITTLEDTENAAAIVEALGGTPEKASVEGYGVTQDGKLSYTPISNDAKKMGKVAKYNSVESVTKTIQVGNTVVEYSVPTRATAYDAVPIAYKVYASDGQVTKDLPVHIEAVAFEETDRYNGSSALIYDCNLPGKVEVEMTYEGYVNAATSSGAPMLSTDPTQDVQGTKYPAFDTTELQKTGTVKSDAYCTWFKFSYENTGKTILDGEGNGAFRFYPLLYKKNSQGGWSLLGGNPNQYYPLLDYVYPGDTGDLWMMFTGASGSNSYGLLPGDYKIEINGCLRNERASFDFATNQVAGKTVTKSTFEFTVTKEGGQSTPNAVVNTGSGSIARNGWLGNFEEFMSSYTSLFTIGESQETARTGVIYVQLAPWTQQIVMKAILGNSQNAVCVRFPVEVETDSIEIELNPYNKNYVIKEDGTRTPMIMTQNMTDMRGNIDRGPYCDQTILNDMLNMKEAGINTITTTHAFTGNNNGFYDMSMFMLDCARKLGFAYEGHCLYYYRGTDAISRAKTLYPGIDLGNLRDIFNLSQYDAANGILAKWNLNRYGDFYVYDHQSKEIPISIEENYGWFTYNIWNRYGVDNAYADRQLRNWLKTAYNNDIDALNEKYGSSYSDFRDIEISTQGISDGVGTVLNGNVYGKEWNAATVELDLFRTAKRTEYYKEMLNYLDVEGAKVYLRSENGIFLAPGISPTTDNAHYRNIYYEQRQSASVPEVLAASGIIYGDSSYMHIPLTDSEVYELTRQAAKGGFNTAKTPNFTHMTDTVINEYVGNYDYTEKYNLDTYQKACAINRNASLFTWNKAMYEAGGVAGTMWMDYACDLYVTSTQYRELQFFCEKIEEMLATEEGKAWATNIPEEETQSPLSQYTQGAYSFNPEYIDEKLSSVNRHNMILDFCK